MKRVLQLALYPAAGGALLALADPPRGWLSTLLVLGYIVCAAYVDAWLGRAASPVRRHERGNVISIALYRNHKFRRGAPFRLRSRMNSKSVFQTPLRTRAEELFQALQTAGLHPRIVQRQASDNGDTALYEVRLPEDQVEPARPIVQMFQFKAAHLPS